jgi:hypothetical protein
VNSVSAISRTRIKLKIVNNIGKKDDTRMGSWVHGRLFIIQQKKREIKDT